MIKKYQKKLVLLMIVALVVLNIWRWLPTSANRPETLTQKTGMFNVEDFEVRASGAHSTTPILRDIFQAKKIAKEKTQVKIKTAEVHLAPVKSQEELARESAEAEFGKIRCVGVSVRNERTQAYVISGGEPLLISKGDKVGSRFVVEKITPDGVNLRDPETGVGGLVSISGK